MVRFLRWATIALLAVIVTTAVLTYPQLRARLALPPPTTIPTVLALATPTAPPTQPARVAGPTQPAVIIQPAAARPQVVAQALITATTIPRQELTTPTPVVIATTSLLPQVFPAATIAGTGVVTDSMTPPAGGVLEQFLIPADGTTTPAPNAVATTSLLPATPTASLTSTPAPSATPSPSPSATRTVVLPPPGSKGSVDPLPTPPLPADAPATSTPVVIVPPIAIASPATTPTPLPVATLAVDAQTVTTTTSLTVTTITTSSTVITSGTLITAPATIEVIATPTLIVLPGAARPTVNVTVALYAAPDVRSTVVGQAITGTSLDIVAVHTEGSWFLLTNGLWIPASAVSNAPRQLPLVVPTITPVPTPTFTITPTPLPTVGTPGTETPTPLPTSLDQAICSCNADAYACLGNVFPSQAAAQACFEYCFRETSQDIHALDPNANGLACEALP